VGLRAGLDDMEDRKFLNLPGLELDPSAIQPLPSRYTDSYHGLSFLVAPTLGSLLPLLECRAEFPQFLDQGQSVGLLGWVISSSQGLYQYTNTEKRTHIHKH
jgi:hypothetical protein